MFVNKAKYLDHTKLDLGLTHHAEVSEKKEMWTPHRAKLIPVCMKQFHLSATSVRNVSVYTEKLFKIPPAKKGCDFSLSASQMGVAASAPA